MDSLILERKLARLVALGASIKGVSDVSWLYCERTAFHNLVNPQGELGHLFEWLSVQITGTKMTRINLRKRLCLVLSSRCGLD